MGKVTYFPQLDALRGIAFLCIFLFHLIEPGSSSAEGISAFFNYLHSQLWFGIEIFFVLSSFLLTYLGLKEYEQTGHFSLRHFFIRRVLRIWPLYYLFLGAAFLVIKPLATTAHAELVFPDSLAYLFFISNFDHTEHVFFLRLLWTLSVEEQFYFLLGFVLRYYSKGAARFFYLLIFGSIVFGITRIAQGKGIYFHTINYFFDFGVGGVAAIAFYRFSERIKRFFSGNRYFLVFFIFYLPVHFGLFFIINGDQRNAYFDLLSRYLFILYIGLFILWLLSQPKRGLWLARNRFLLFTGKISFGLYVYHGVILSGCKFLLQKGLLPAWSQAPLVIVFTYVTATISYYGMERHFLRLKNKVRWAVN